MIVKLEINGVYTTVEPIYENIENKYVEDEHTGGYLPSVTTEFTFINTPLHSTFDFFANLDNNSSGCVTTKIAIFYDDLTTNAEGEIKTTDGDFDYDSYTFKCKFADAEISVISDKEEVNLYDLVEYRRSIRFYEGSLKIIEYITGVQGYPYILDRRIDSDGNVVRKTALEQNPNGAVPLWYRGYNYVEESPIPTEEYDWCARQNMFNALKLEDVLNKLFKSGTGIIHHIESDFFGIGNQTPDFPNNEAYTFATDYCKNIMFVGGTEIDRTTDTDQTIYDISPYEFWEDLKLIFKLRAVMVGNVLSIEHVSHQKAGVLIDLINSGHIITVEPKYKYDSSEAPISKSFSFAVNSDNFEFDNVTLNNDCGESSETTISTTHIVTNVMGWTGDEERSDFGDKLVMLSCSALNIVNRTQTLNNKHRYENYAGSGNDMINGCFGFINLIQNLHIWDMPTSSSSIDYTVKEYNPLFDTAAQQGHLPDIIVKKKIELTAKTSKTGKTQDIQIEVGEEDWKLFTPNSFIRTQFGKGKIVEVTRNTDNILKAKLLFQK